MESTPMIGKYAKTIEESTPLPIMMGGVSTNMDVDQGSTPEPQIRESPIRVDVLQGSLRTPSPPPYEEDDDYDMEHMLQNSLGTNGFGPKVSRCLPRPIFLDFTPSTPHMPQFMEGVPTFLVNAPMWATILWQEIQSVKQSASSNEQELDMRVTILEDAVEELQQGWVEEKPSMRNL